MTSERWQQIEAVFREAVRREGDKRLSYLEKACQGDADLRVEVESLLASDSGGGLLEGSALDSLATEDLASAMDEWCAEPQPKPEPQAQLEPPEVATPVAGVSAPAGSELTVASFASLSAQGGPEPILGWLVCVQGPDQGRDYRIRCARNRIGRASLMDICIEGDNSVSRDTHAIITYDPSRNRFRLYPGSAHGIVYLNGRCVDGASELSAYDLIELGKTGLRFVPFCGERFQWT